MPLFPYLSLVAAFGIFYSFDKLLVSFSTSKTSLIILFLLFYPYWLTFKKSQANEIPIGEKKLEACEEFIFKNQHKINFTGLKIYSNDWPGALLFYKYKLSEKGQKVEIVTSSQFSINDKILVSKDSLFNEIKQNYEFIELEKLGNAKYIEITALKNSEAGYNLYQHCLTAVKEQSLRENTTYQNELRFFSIAPSFKGGNSFYKVNFTESKVICKRFECQKPDGSGKDTLLNCDTILITEKNISELQYLVKKSMLWQLKSEDDDKVGPLDCEYYFYEATREIRKHDLINNRETYCLVKRYCPQNSDFIALGENLKRMFK